MELKRRDTCAYCGQVLPKEPKEYCECEEISKEAELKLRKYLWLSHGHTGQYGDDGEMQCMNCSKYGIVDYKREPLEKVIDTAIKAKEIQALLKAQEDSCSKP